MADIQARILTDEPAPAVGQGMTKLRANISSAMILLNGTLLTLTAFLALSFYITWMADTEMRLFRNDMQQFVHERLMDIKFSLNTVVTLAELAENQENLDYMRRALSRQDFISRVFSALYWIEPNAQGRPDVSSLYADENGTAAAGALPFDADSVIRMNAAEPGSFAVLADSALRDAQDKAGGGNIRPLVIVRPVQNENGRFGYVAAIARPDFLVHYRPGREVLVAVSVMREGSGDVYYNAQYAREEPGLHGFEEIKEMLRIPFGDTWLIVNMSLAKWRQLYVLELLPWVFLMVGLAATAAGWLFVARSQRYAAQLAIVNEELAVKNSELGEEIKERERINHAFRKAERENRAVIDAVSDVIFEVSRDGKVLFLNATWEHITNIEIERCLGSSLFEMLHPQDQEEQKRDFIQMVEGNKHAYRSFTRLKTADGTYRSVEMAISMLRRDENRNIRVVGTFTDVEERRRAERALSEAERKYRTIWENAAGGIYQVTWEGQFLSANPSLARLLGYGRPEDLLREVPNMHNLYKSVRERQNFLRELERSDGPIDTESRIRRPDGGLIWVNEHARVVRDEDGNILYIEGAIEDITRRKEIEFKLREAKIQSDLASRAKSEFLANMSHELRTPLNAIIGFSEIITSESCGPVGQRVYWEYARDIHESGRQLLAVINEILDVSRIEAGQRQINEGLVDVGRVINTSIELMRSKASEAGLTVSFESGAEELPRLVGEGLAIKQMLTNLLSNAIKFTHSGGRVTVSAQVARDGDFRIDVSDTGIGLDEHEIHKALSPFGQIDTGLGRTTTGAGLGLTLVDSLARLHGGRLELFSEKGIGTTATIVFPAARVSWRDEAAGPSVCR